MLSELKVKNFKSIAQAGLSLARVNILIGENGSGKSSFVQALALLKQSLGTGSLLPSGRIMDLGTFSEVLHKPIEQSDEMEFTIAGTTFYGKPIAIHGETADGVGFQYSWASNDGNPSRMSTVLRVGNFEAKARWSPRFSAQISPQSMSVGRVNFSLGLATGVGQGLIVGGESPAPDTEEAAMNQARLAMQNFLQAPANAITRFFFVPAMRGIERQTYDLGEQVSEDLMSPGGSLAVSQALATTVAYQRELEATLGEWLERVTNRGIRVRLTPGRRVSLDAVAQGIPVNIVNEGFGSNQLTHLLTVLARLPGDAMLAIEEPEIHLHPAAQTSLMNLLVEVTAARKSQLLMTTHSEHVLYAIMALVGERALRPEDVAIHHVGLQQGQTTARRLDLDSAGRIKGGLPGFFNVHVQEFRRFLEAAEKNQ